MKKYSFPVGCYQRQGDADNELSLENRKKFIKRVNYHLAWLGSLEQLEKEKKKSSLKKDKQDAQKFIDLLKKIPVIKNHSSVKRLDHAKKEIPLWALDLILSRGRKVMHNLSQGRKVTSGSTTLGIMGLGILVGVVFGAIILPGIGGFLGGAISSAISSGIALVGGPIGCGLIGGAIGAYGGHALGKKTFGFSEKYRLPTAVHTHWSDTYGIDKDTIDAMNQYLLNRIKAISSPSRKKALRSLRRVGIKQLSPIGINKLAAFFCHELKALLNEDLYHEAVINDIQALKHFLKVLKGIPVLGSRYKKRIKKYLNHLSITCHREGLNAYTMTKADEQSSDYEEQLNWSDPAEIASLQFSKQARNRPTTSELNPQDTLSSVDAKGVNPSSISKSKKSFN